VTPPISLAAKNLALNVDAGRGEVRVQVTTESGEPIPGFRFEDCQPITGDSLEAAVKWSQPLSKLQGKSIRLEFWLRGARLFGFIAS
jgi:hypothetical protein